MITLSNRQGRQFILLKQGLLGGYRFVGKQGALDFVQQAGCVQFDPVDVCGKNAELTLQSRVKGFTKRMLFELLYVDRKLIDYPDKNLAIIPAEDWPYFERSRKAAREGGRQFDELAELEDIAKAYIKEHGPVSSDDLPITGGIRWHSSIAGAATEQHYSCAVRAGASLFDRRIVSIIKLVQKIFTILPKHIPAEILHAPDHAGRIQHKKWRILRRIGAVRLLWNRPSDAWLNRV